MYKMGEINREILLGYLMNALEDDEISHVERELLRQPTLRAELAALQQELSPLNAVYESVAPPPNLARRTCDKIWAAVEREEQMGQSFTKATEVGPIISLSLPEPHFNGQSSAQRGLPEHSQAVEELVAASSHLPESVPKRLVRRSEKKGHRSIFPKKRKMSNSSVPSTKRGRWIDVFTSVGVGILIAVIVFPVINYSKNQAQSYFTQNKLRKINQNVGRYEQIQGAVAQVEASEPANQLNLAHFGWQELKPDQIPFLVVNNDSNTLDPQLGIASSIESDPLPFAMENLTPVSGLDSLIADGNSDHNIILGQVGQDSFIGSALGLADSPVGLSNQTLYSNVGQILPVAAGSTLQTAYGQNVLFHNGRIFIRRVPVVSPVK